MTSASPALLDDSSPDSQSASSRVLAFVDRMRWWFVLPILSMHLLVFTGRWRPSYDSAEFLILGRHLREHGHMRTVGGEAEGVMPGYPWLLSKLGGDPVLPALLVNAVALVAWLVFTFLLMRRVCGRSTAVLVTLLCGVSARAMEASADVLPGMVFASVVAGVLWVESWRGFGFLKVFSLLVLVLTAVLLRSVGVLLVPALLLSWFWQWNKAREIAKSNSGLFAVFVMLMGAAVLGAVLMLVPALRGDVGVLMVKLGGSGVAGVLRSSWEALRAAVPEAVFGLDMSVFFGPWLGVVALASGVALIRRRVFWGVWVLLMALPWLLFLASPRYVVPMLPLLWLGLWLAMVGVEKRWPGAGTGWAVFVLLFVGVAGNVVGVVHLCLEQHCEPFVETYRDGAYGPAHDAAAWLQEHTLPGARVLVTEHERPALTWWSGRAAVGRVSTPAVNAGVLYAVEPLDAAALEAMDGLGWTLGPVLHETRAGRGGVVWTLHEVDRAASDGLE